MGRVKAVFDGAIVAEPRVFQAGSSHGIDFPVYVNDEDKKDGVYVKNENVTKIKVTLWNDAADNADIQKGDIVEVTASIVEKEFEGKNGAGRSLSTKFVDSVVLKYRKPGGSDGFTPVASSDGFI